jgi:hypothetical protein
MPTGMPASINPKLRKLYESSKRLAYLRAEMERARKAAAGLATITAAYRAHRAKNPATLPTPAAT